jgi:excisionase family DNA binding protein
VSEPAAQTVEVQAARALAEYITAEDFAARLKCSTKSIYRLANSDPSLPVLRLGKLVRFPRVRLEGWLRAHEQGAGRVRLRVATKAGPEA